MTVPATTQPTHEFPSEDRHASRTTPRHDAPAGGRATPWALPVPGSAPVPPRAGAPAPGLLEILRCPLTGGTLIPVDADRLMSDRPFRDGVHPVYPIVRGIACLAPAR